MLDFQDEIDTLESVMASLEAAMIDIQDTPYHSYMAQGWETDLEEIKARLEELYEIQNDYWAKEMKQQNIEFEESVV